MVQPSSPFFSREKLQNDLKNKSVRGAFIRIISTSVSAVLTMISTIVLARLLTPAEFGLFAMVMAITEFARQIMELGLGTATVQRETITHEEVSTLFWINLSIGIILAMSVAGISPLVSSFYQDSRLLPVCMAMSIFFLFGGITVQHRSLLERQMHFGYLAIIYVVSNLLGICIAVGLAIYGFGVWSLVCRELVSAGSCAAGMWIFCNWTPSIPKLNKSVIANLCFGVNISSVSIIQYFTQNFDRVLIGRFYGAAPLGFYSKAMQLAMLPIEHIRMTILGVGISPLSTLQNQAERYCRYCSRLLSILSFLYMPLVVLIVIQSADLIRLILGERWIGAAPYLRILAMAGFTKPIMSICQMVMISCGKTSRYLRWGIICGIGTILSYIIGIHWNVIGVAYAYTFISYTLLGWSLWYCFRETPVNFLIIIKTLFLPVTSSLGAGIILISLLPLLSDMNIFVKIIFSIIIIAVVYLGIWIMLPEGRQKLSEFCSYRFELFKSA